MGVVLACIDVVDFDWRHSKANVCYVFVDFELIGFFYEFGLVVVHVEDSNVLE